MKIQILQKQIFLLSRVVELLTILIRIKKRKVYLVNLAKAIQKFEGWYESSISWVCNNPGNLRFSKFQTGQFGGYAYFSSYQEGFDALMWDLKKKCEGKTKTGLNGNSTIEELINVYAPLHDNNNTEDYINFICQELRIPRTFLLRKFVY